MSDSDFEEVIFNSSGLFVFAFASETWNFEWGNFLSSIGVSHALFKDRFDLWYRDGVYGFGDAAALVGYMKSKRKSFGPMITLGLSKGSWAALKFGKLAEVDRVIAISVNSGCGKSLDEFPPRWHHRLEYSELSADLKPLYEVGKNPYVHAYVSDGNGLPTEAPEIDRIMAQRINADKITFIPGYTHGGENNLARGIRNNGILKQEILELCKRRTS